MKSQILPEKYFNIVSSHALRPGKTYPHHGHCLQVFDLLSQQLDAALTGPASVEVKPVSAVHVSADSEYLWMLLVVLSSALAISEELIWTGSRQQAAKINTAVIVLKGHQIVPECSVKCFSVLIDTNLTFAPHIRRVAAGCFWQIRQLWKIRRSLSVENAN